MKLIYCVECNSLLNLSLDEEKKCSCGKSKGQYTDNIYAWYEGPCFPVGFKNSSFKDALYEQPESGNRGKEFIAFVIQKDCPTFIRRGNIVPQLKKRATTEDLFLFIQSQMNKKEDPSVTDSTKKTSKRKKKV